MAHANSSDAGMDDPSIADGPSSAGNSLAREKQSRIYRACVHCRQRKSKCILDGGSRSGLPPCRRCVREGRDCILAGSRRGGRRPKKGHHQNEDSADASSQWYLDPATSEQDHGAAPPPESEQTPAWEDAWQPRRPSAQGFDSAGQSEPMETAIDTADIQNPAEALDSLEILAQVAGGHSERQDSRISASLQSPRGHEQPHEHFQDFPLYVSGQVAYQDILDLFTRYLERFHPYFPIVPSKWFDPANINSMSSSEPHLFAAVLAISAADLNATIHKEVSKYIHELITELTYGGDAEVEAVEALLILSEWATVWRHSSPNRTSKGPHEDRYAWMLVGLAIRLAIYLGLEQTSFRSSEPKEASPEHFRRRLTWTACYMADRSVSIRVGKGFWSRGPGPTSFFEARDFPTLKATTQEDTDYASIFKANLELIHIFSNAFDVLYRGEGMKLRLSSSSGAYVKYIDDFRTAIRGWHSRYMHPNFAYPANIRCTLLLLYDYLRLYVNAFAFQASASRLSTGERFPVDNVASLPDARFIYEAVDAAKSLLMTVNKFVDPHNCLRFLPLRFYSYIVYSSVFLYKALGTMGREERESVRRMVNDTVSCLMKSSDISLRPSPKGGPPPESTHLGARYAQLISLLWRRPPKQTKKPSNATSNPSANDGVDYLYPSSQKPLDGDLNSFSWLDLSAVGDFATRNNNTAPEYPELDFADLSQSNFDAFADSQWFDTHSTSFLF